MATRRRSTPESVAAKRAQRAGVTETGPVLEAAAAFLAVRSRSVAEVSRRLEHLGYSSDIVERVVEELTTLGYLDDEAFARSWVESRDRARPRGESALRRELVLKGVPREVIDVAIDGRRPREDGGTPDLIAAAKLLARRRSSLEREADLKKRRQRAYALLARNGFDPETCREAASAFIREQSPE